MKGSWFLTKSPSAVRSVVRGSQLQLFLPAPCPACAVTGGCFSVSRLWKIHITERVEMRGDERQRRALSVSSRGLPEAAVAKNPPAVPEDPGSIPGLGRSPGGGNGNPLQ